jgi:hypothetical protein
MTKAGKFRPFLHAASVVGQTPDRPESFDGVTPGGKARIP